MRLLPFGREALLAEVADVASAVALRDALDRAMIPGVLELVPAARTVLVRFDPGRVSADVLASAIRALPVATSAVSEGPIVEIPTVYDGEDLADVARAVGLDADEVVRRHAARLYDVAFTGFAPGFAYLTGGDPALVVPRRSSPRTAIPAGAVGLAGEFSGVYPRSSPGGWQLIGRALVPMWEPSREPPALLTPGARVRFVPVAPSAGGPAGICARSCSSGRPELHDRAQMRGESDRGVEVRGAEVLGAGVLATVQDLGRDGHAAAGVARSGAVDRAALRRGNRLVGNPVDAAGIEFVGGIELRAVGDLIVAVTGAAGAPTRADRPIELRDGEVLTIGSAEAGVYGYLAVLGGVDVPPVLGSRSTDVLSGLGPAPLRAGDLLPIGTAHGAAVSDGPEPGPGLPAVGGAHVRAVTIDVVPGPRDDWFRDPGALTAREWTVTPRSNRVGVRLAGEPLTRTDEHEGAELPSEPMLPGAIQVPPDGQPVVFAADHPVTGGYPVVGVVVPEHLGTLAQVPAGGAVRFRVAR